MRPNGPFLPLIPLCETASILVTFIGNPLPGKYILVLNLNNTFPKQLLFVQLRDDTTKGSLRRPEQSMLLQMLTIFFISMPQITYAFANNSEQLVNEKVLGHVLLEGISNFHPFFVAF